MRFYLFLRKNLAKLTGVFLSFICSTIIGILSDAEVPFWETLVNYQEYFKISDVTVAISFSLLVITLFSLILMLILGVVYKCPTAECGRY